MIDFIMNQKGDMHSWVGSKMYSKKLGKEVIVSKTENEDIRNKAKSLGFLINYGGSSFALAGKLDISNEEGEELINMYFDTFPALKKYHDTAKKEALKNGFILINRVSGRKAFIPEYAEFLKLKAINYDDRNQEDTRRFYKLKGAIEREAVNYKIQGTAADQTKMALIKIRNYIKSNNIDALIVSVIHDEIVVDAEESIAEELAKTVSELMREAGNLFVTKVDMVSTPKIENTWVK
jgi:DNA polymerase-1